MSTHQHILDQLPYGPAFRFVDSLIELNDNGALGEYTFREDAAFYRDHFIDNPITPGVLLTECMAQIGLVCLGIHLMEKEQDKVSKSGIALVHADVDFLHPVLPGETVRVQSEKLYFRFGKLKCRVLMQNSQGTTICMGTLSGMSNTSTS